MAKKGHRILVALVCSQCGSQNYITERSKLNTPKKMVLKKYCKHCRQKTEHKEAKRLK